MTKTLVLGLATLVFSFFVGVSYIHAQEATETPTTTPTPTAAADNSTDTSEDLPTAPPQTGFGY